MGTWKKWRAVLSVAIAVVAMIPTPAMAWGSAQTLTATGEGGQSPRMAVAPDGDVTAVWARYTGSGRVIRAARRPSGGAWSDPVTLSGTGVVHDGTQGPSVVVDGEGTATVVWTRRVNGEHRVEAVRRRAGGAWSNPTVLRQTAWQVGPPEVTVDGSGRVYVAWSRSRGVDRLEQEVEVARRTADGWTASVRVSGDRELAGDPAVDVDHGGNATVVWRRSNGSTDAPAFRVRAVRRPAGGPWGNPQTLSHDSVQAIDLAVDHNGDTVVAWQRSTGSGGVIEAIRRPAGAGWGEPRQRSAAGLPAFGPTVDAAGGRIVLAWVQMTNATDYRQRVMATTWRDGSWRATRAVSDHYDGLHGLEVDLNADGQAVLAWTKDHDPYDGEDPETVHAARLRTDGSWGDPQRLSSIEWQSYVGAVVLRRNGPAWVIWDSIRADYTGNMIIQIIKD